jgi:hypothetical protein
MFTLKTGLNAQLECVHLIKETKKNINKDSNSNTMGSKDDEKWIESEKKTFLCKKVFH